MPKHTSVLGCFQLRLQLFLGRDKITFGSSTFCTETVLFRYKMASKACLVPDQPYSGTKKQGDNALIVAAENILGYWNDKAYVLYSSVWTDEQNGHL